MVSSAAMKVVSTRTKLLKITAKESMMPTSCRMPMIAARPEKKSKRMAIYASISTAASVTLLIALLIRSRPAMAPTRVMSTYSMAG